MTAVRWRPFGTSMDRWGNVSDGQTEVNRLFDNFFGRPASAASAREWAPPVDLYETKDDLVLTMEVPGVRDKDVTVSITSCRRRKRSSPRKSRSTFSKECDGVRRD